MICSAVYNTPEKIDKKWYTYTIVYTERVIGGRQCVLHYHVVFTRINDNIGQKISE